MRKHLKRAKLAGDIRDHQSGHNSEMSEARYGIMREDMDQLMPEKLLAFSHASQQWHRLLGFDIKDDIKTKSSEIKMSEAESRKGIDQEEIVLMAKRGIETGLIHMRRNFRSKRRQEETLPISTTMISVGNKCLKALRKFYNDRTAQFKLLEQAMALQSIIDGRRT